MPVDALVDGLPADPVWLSERALQYGDGLFETIAVVGSRPCLWDLHMTRLVQGCRCLRLPLPDFAQLADEAASLCAGRERAVLKLYWTAGSSSRGYRRPTPLLPRRMLLVSDWSLTTAPGLWSVRLCEHRLSVNPTLAQIKHLNRLDQVLGRAEWDDAEIQEGLMRDPAGHVVSGTMSNIFLQRAGRLLTPRVDAAGVAGVVRALVLQLDGASGNVAETLVTLEQIRAADALYLTNSLIGVIRVARFEDRVYDTDVTEHPLMNLARQRCHEAAEEKGGK